jgi:hypothetical protein
MGAVRTLGLVTAIKGTPTPVVLAAAYYTSSNLATPGVVIPVASFSILNNIATVVLGGSGLPTIGFNGENGYIPTPTFSPANPTQEVNLSKGKPFDIYGGIAPGPRGRGEQVTLWGFGTGTYFNGKRITVLDNNPATNSFRFYFAHANVASTADTTGFAAPSPAQHYRVIRIECAQTLGTDLLYVGDLNVSSTQYMAALSLAGQFSIEVAGENIPPEGLFLDTSGTAGTTQAMISVIY